LYEAINTEGDNTLKKHRLMLRILCAILTVCLGMAAASPIAHAVTPKQEAALAGDQRSANNPQGGFQAPGAAARYLGFYPFWSFHPDTLNAGWLLLQNILQQMFLGNGDAESFRRVFDYAPVIKEGDQLPPKEDFWPGEGLPFLPYSLYMLQKGMLDIYIALKETQEPGVYRVVLFYVTRAGEERWLDVGTLYDAAKGTLLSENGEGVMNIGYEYDIGQQMLLGAPNGWNRDLGYYNFFDTIAPFLLYRLDTLRFPFTYDGRDWMVWFWKGYYVVANGAEIGIYENPAGWPVRWAASDTEMDITMQVYQGDHLYADYGPSRTWWAAGISYAKPFFRQLPASQLRVTGTIAFEDPGLLAAFLESFERNRTGNITGTVEEMKFLFDWQAG